MTKSWRLTAGQDKTGMTGASYGYKLPNDLFVTLDISQSRDADFWVALTLFEGDRKRNDRLHAMPGGRIRSPLPGGGNMVNGYEAIRKFRNALYDFACNPVLDLPFPQKPARAKPWQWRPLDDGHGWLGLMVARGGHFVMAALPDEEKLEYGRHSLAVTFRHEETPLMVRSTLRALYNAMATDNRKHAGFCGNHA